MISILAIILSIIYINDTPLNINSHSVLFANDSSAIIQSDQTGFLLEEIMNTPYNLDCWFQLNT